MLHNHCRLAGSKMRLSALLSSSIHSGSRSIRAFSSTRRILAGPATTGDSIFSSTSSAWDHVFDDIDQLPPLFPSRNPSGGLYSSSSQGSPQNIGRTRRQAMTAKEISAFDDMFNLIFSAVSEHKPTSSSSSPEEHPSVGVGKNALGDLFGKLRRHSKKVKWTTETDELLDRKKEEMDLCDTDQQLLDWAMREVFAQSVEYTEAAQNAKVSKEQEKGKMVDLQPATYSHMIALLMKTFRDKYRDPHLALSIFDYARHLSIPSYVFGCSTMAYNELIQTRWTCFRDLKGVHDALEEMNVNGVESDARTLQLIDRLRTEVGERNTWQEESELGSGEVYQMLTKIDRLLQHSAGFSQPSSKETAPKKWNQWKTEEEEGDWEFGNWEMDKSRKSKRVRARKPIHG